MNYHETVPTDTGNYWTATEEVIELYSLKCFCNGEYVSPERLAASMPLLGPLPESREAALSIACDVAFARMVAAWCRTENSVTAKPLGQRYLDGERTLALLRDMERVTEQLTKAT